MSTPPSRERPSAPASAEERFDALWREHASAVLRYAHRRVHPDEAEEVLAETFVVAWRRLDQAPGYPLPWLLGIARRTAANLLRSRKRQTALQDRVAAQPDATHHLEQDHSPTGAALALAALRQRDRELLTLIAWDGLAPAEAAQVLGCSPGALAVRLHRARARFAAALRQGAAGDQDAPNVDLRTTHRPPPERTARTGPARPLIDGEPS